MKLGRNRITGFDRYLTSWKSVDDPSPGNFSYRLDPNGFPQILLKQGSTVKSRLGPWIGVRNGGVPNLNPNLKYTYEFVLTEQEMYCHYQFLNRSVISHLYLNPDGVVQRFTWVDQTQNWVLYLVGPSDVCDLYTYCGAYASCKISMSQVCKCLNGFLPKVQQNWSSLNRIGCVRINALGCKRDIFRKYSGLKLPDTRSSWFDRSMDLQEYPEGGGKGCLLWFGDLTDIREYDEHVQDIYVRMFDLDPGHSSRKKGKLILGLISGTLLLFLSLILMVYVQKKKAVLKHLQIRLFNSVFSGRICTSVGGSENVECSGEDPEPRLFEFATIANATNYFATDNKLGEGGFGPVYRGMLKNSQEIAVKKLSRSSGQGLDEFKSEALHLARLQHRDLVKLLGCCVQKEMLLLYEYIPNKSLDSFIFDQEQRKLLGWSKRFHIISGIAWGLFYLHQDSRLRIIHRDLKASNVLLDCELNPKISDFGLAKSFGGNKTQACKKLEHIFSAKSDVFSYGLSMLEIISGTRNRGFSHPLLGHAWKLFQEGRRIEFVDPVVSNSYNVSEIMRTIHVGLLCVQKCPEDRPTMYMVILMLGSDMALSAPEEPGFFSETKGPHANARVSQPEPCSLLMKLPRQHYPLSRRCFHHDL
ncbi:hypothetical protein EUGRSUZ_F03373 [Eucalyptus grandis]|uniref:Uncharacterized protein n=2 Tax=Eucalyptus grandis TaxID=71139 RepID=A0ACC3KM06_EUCGR|nr:hypothetical protein EUGRSUZ_F03373 [Eucalyptus grandis]